MQRHEHGTQLRAAQRAGAEESAEAQSPAGALCKAQQWLSDLDEQTQKSAGTLLLPHLHCKSGQQVLPQQPLHSPTHSTCELKGQMVASLQAWASQCGLQRCKAGAQVLCHLQSTDTLQSQSMPGCNFNPFSHHSQ